jgi:hypothetical protein
MFYEIILSQIPFLSAIIAENLSAIIINVNITGESRL